MAKKYEHNVLMKILTILGGLVGLASAILVIANYDLPATYSAFDRVISGIVGIVVSFLGMIFPQCPLSLTLAYIISRDTR